MSLDTILIGSNAKYIPFFENLGFDNVEMILEDVGPDGWDEMLDAIATEAEVQGTLLRKGNMMSMKAAFRQGIKNKNARSAESPQKTQRGDRGGRRNYSEDYSDDYDDDRRGGRRNDRKTERPKNNTDRVRTSGNPLYNPEGPAPPKINQMLFYDGLGCFRAHWIYPLSISLVTCFGGLILWDLRIKFSEPENTGTHNYDDEFFGVWQFIEGLCIFGWIITVLSFIIFMKAWNRNPELEQADTCGDCEDANSPA